MTNETCRRRPQLFTLRVWQEDLSEGRTEWRGQLRHVTSGQTRYFRDWQALIPLLLRLLEDAEAPPDQA
jgi:hypothetical protein